MIDERKNPNGSPEDRQIKRLTIIQKIVSDIRYTIPLIITLVGALGVTNRDHIASFINGDVDVPEGELAEIEPGQPDYAIAIRAINAKLKKHDAALESIQIGSENGDSKLEQRVQKLEEHH